MKKSLIKYLFATVLLAFVFSGCSEQLYYRHNNRHSPRYEERHKKNARPEFDLEIRH